METDDESNKSCPLISENPGGCPFAQSIGELISDVKWLRQGAQPTATASRLLTKTGVMEKFKATKEKT